MPSAVTVSDTDEGPVQAYEWTKYFPSLASSTLTPAPPAWASEASAVARVMPSASARIEGFMAFLLRRPGTMGGACVRLPHDLTHERAPVLTAHGSSRFGLVARHSAAGPRPI